MSDPAGVVRTSGTSPPAGRGRLGRPILPGVVRTSSTSPPAGRGRLGRPILPGVVRTSGTSLADRCRRGRFDTPDLLSL